MQSRSSMMNFLPCVTLALTTAQTEMALALKAPFQGMFNVLDISNCIWLNLGIQLVSPDARVLFVCFFTENRINWLRHSRVPLRLKILNVSMWGTGFFKGKHTPLVTPFSNLCTRFLPRCLYKLCKDLQVHHIILLRINLLNAVLRRCYWMQRVLI